MEIYVKDIMDMPTNCDDCPLGSDCPHDQNIDGYKMQGGRPRTCPLIPVPPHGDLIDRKELIKEDHQHYEYISDEFYVTVRDIEDAPTIIPKSEEE